MFVCLCLFSLFVLFVCLFLVVLYLFTYFIYVAFFFLQSSWRVLLQIAFLFAFILGVVGLWYARELGLITPWTGRFYS
jgi:hypothetical protein